MGWILNAKVVAENFADPSFEKAHPALRMEESPHPLDSKPQHLHTLHFRYSEPIHIGSHNMGVKLLCIRQENVGDVDPG